MLWFAVYDKAASNPPNCMINSAELQNKYRSRLRNEAVDEIEPVMPAPYAYGKQAA